MPRKSKDDKFDKPGGRALERLRQFESSRRPQGVSETDDGTEKIELCPVCLTYHGTEEDHVGESDESGHDTEEMPKRSKKK